MENQPHKFQVGDRVRIVGSGFSVHSEHYHVGEEVTILSVVDETVPYTVTCSAGDENDWKKEENLELILRGGEKTEMAVYLNELTEAQKEHLDPETQALMRTGVIDSCLNTNNPKAVDMLVRLNYSAIAKLAQKDIDEQEAKEKASTKGK